MIYKHIEIVKAISRRVVLPGFQSQDRVEAISISEFFLFCLICMVAWRRCNTVRFFLFFCVVRRSLLEYIDYHLSVIRDCDLTTVEYYHLVRTEKASLQFL
jgi:hypothetical protein